MAQFVILSNSPTKEDLMETLAAGVGVPVLIWGSWLVSLRRTPWASLWAILCAVYCIAMTVSALAIAATPASHVTTLGVLGMDLGFAAPAWIAMICTEVCATEPGPITRFRGYKSTKSRRSRRTGKWEIRPLPPEPDGRVPVVISNRRAERRIGACDPLEDMDAFMDLRTRAAQAAETFNAPGNE